MWRSPEGPYKLESIQTQYNTNWKSNLVLVEFPWEKRWGLAQGGLPGGQAERRQVSPTEDDGEDDGKDGGEDDGEDDGKDGGEDGGEDDGEDGGEDDGEDGGEDGGEDDGDDGGEDDDEDGGEDDDEEDYDGDGGDYQVARRIEGKFFRLFLVCWRFFNFSKTRLASLGLMVNSTWWWWRWRWWTQ